MEGESAFQSYLDGALETFGIAADEDERAVMMGVWSLYEPGMEALRDADLDEHRAGAARRPLQAARAMSASTPSTFRCASRPTGSQRASSTPGELLDACLARIEERNPDLNAVVATFPDRSREMLEQAPDGPLRGVPVLIKDEWPLPWRAETVGAASVPGVTLEPGESGPYRALRDAGAVIAGVANMHELGSSSTGNTSLYGPAHNPWDLERCPGGSSSGPAAAVAGGLVAGAVGADGLGSIRYPAAYCGLTGLKPTFGRSAMEGHHIANTETIVSGPLCRDAADCRLLASVLFGEELPVGQPSGLRDRRGPGSVLERLGARRARGMRGRARGAAWRGGRRGRGGRAAGPGPDPAGRAAGRAGGGGGPPRPRRPERS